MFKPIRTRSNEVLNTNRSTSNLSLHTPKLLNDYNINNYSRMSSVDKRSPYKTDRNSEKNNFTLFTDINDEEPLNNSVLAPDKKSRYFSRVYGVDNPVEKHLHGYSRHHDQFKHYNLNSHQYLNEDYKYLQDNFYKTKYNFTDNKIIQDKYSKNDTLADKIKYTHDHLYKNDERYVETSKVDFYINYKLINKINDEYNLISKKPDYSTTYINNCMKSNTCPRGYGIMRKSNSAEKLEGMYGRDLIRNMVDSYRMMPNSDYPEEIDLSNNFLKKNDVIPFIQTLRPKIKLLNFRNNVLEHKGVYCLAEQLYETRFDNFETLNLENVRMGDKAGAYLMEAIPLLKNLRTLILGKNELSTLTAKQLAKNLEDKSNINYLDLHYNSLVGEDFIDIMKNINLHDHIEYLDISWNKLGSSGTATLALFTMLSDNKKLLKLDVSHNGLKNTETKTPEGTIYSEYEEYYRLLNNNHTLVGLSISGNEFRVDIDGYLRHHYTLRENSYSLGHFQYENMSYAAHRQVTKSEMLFNNWVNEKWVPVEVQCDGKVTEKKIKAFLDTQKFEGSIRLVNVETDVFKLKSRISAEDFLKTGKLQLGYEKVKMEDPLFVHFEFDNYVPWYVPKGENWKSHWMMPPGKWRFFFTTQMNFFLLSELHDIEYLHAPDVKTVCYDKARADVTTWDISIRGYNKIFVPDNMFAVDYANCPVKPRTKPFWSYSEAKISWSFPISIWGKAKWPKDEADLNNKTFDHDWEVVKERLPKALKDDEKEKEKMRLLIRPVYNLFRWLYKYWASYYTVSNIWCIPEMTWLQVFEKLGYWDQYFNATLPPILFRETVTSDKNNYKELCPPNGCVRHQFISFMIKAAARKYKIEPKVNITYTESMEKFLEDNTPKLEKYDPSLWRWDRYYNEACDLYFKALMNVWDNVLTRYMNMYGTKPGEKQFFSLDAFSALINDLELSNYFDDANKGLYFNLSVSVYTSELVKDEFVKIRHKLEFYETVARLADALKFEYGMDGVEYPKTGYESLDLGSKLYCITPQLLRNVFSDKVKSDLQYINEIKTVCNKSQVIKINF